MVWGTFLEKNFPSSNGHLLVLRRVLRLARMLCALMYRQNGDLANLLKLARKKSAPECPFECGGGSNRYLGNAQIEVTLTSKVLPLPLKSVQIATKWISRQNSVCLGSLLSMRSFAIEESKPP